MSVLCIANNVMVVTECPEIFAHMVVTFVGFFFCHNKIIITENNWGKRENMDVLSCKNEQLFDEMPDCRRNKII